MVARLPAVSSYETAGLTRREREVVDAAASGAPVRELARRLAVSQRTVEHHLSAAYRKLGVRSRTELLARLHPPPPEAPTTQYARSGSGHIAFQIVGDGARDVVLIPGFVSNVETAWTWPLHAAFLSRLAAGRRLIVFDKLGTGLSDPVADPTRVTVDERMDEVGAVMDAAGSDRATLFGFSEGAALSLVFAASYPRRTNGLILYGGLISGSLDFERSTLASNFADPFRAKERIERDWGTGRFLAPYGPSLAGDPDAPGHVARFERHGASPQAAFDIIRMAGAIEAADLCPAVNVDCLVLHRRDDTLVPVANSRHLAQHLARVRFVELPGADHPPWIGDNRRLLGEVDAFLAVDHPPPRGDARLLTTLVLSDPPLEPARLGLVTRHRGRAVGTPAGVAYAFDGPTNAIRFALAVAGSRTDARVAVCTGEVTMEATGIRGPAVDGAIRLLAATPAGSVFVTGTARDLVLGSGLTFTAVADGTADPVGYRVQRPSTAGDVGA